MRFIYPKTQYATMKKMLIYLIETLMSLADIFNVPVDYLLGRSAISFKFDKLNKSFFGKFAIAEAIDILSSLDKKAVK